MFINTRDKYSPKSLAEFVYPSSEVEELATAYASGNIDTPLILHGSSGSGKSLLQQLIPNAIENSNALVNDVKCADLKSASDIHNLYGRNKHFNRTCFLFFHVGFSISMHFSLASEKVIEFSFSDFLSA